MNTHYILEGKTPVPCTELEWKAWFHNNDRRVAHTEIDGDKVVVSTFFIGLNTSINANDKPELFETQIFGGSMDEFADKSATWEEAEKLHTMMVTAARATLGVNNNQS